MERQKRNYGENKPERGRSPYKKREGFASRDSEQRNDSSSRRPRIEKEGKVERPQRNFSSDNSRRSYNENRSDERPRRSFNDNKREENPQREYNQDRPRRSFDNNRSDDRPRRSFDNNRSDDRPRRSFTNSREENPQREYNQDRPRRSFDNNRSDDRPKRSFTHNREENSQREYNQDRPRRSFDNNRSEDRPKRDFGSSRVELRPRKSFDSKRPRLKKDDDYFQISGNSKGYSEVLTSKDGLIRLNKYISNSGICSRREADELIQAGTVTVNGEVVTQMGFKVSIDDVVVYGGERLVNEHKKYLLLNKPKGYITTLDDPQERKTVLSLIKNACKERLYPVGRLDRNTTGLLLFTNDGEMTKKLTHPSFGARKIYHVELDKPLTHADIQQIMDGVELEDGRIAADDIQYVGEGEDRRIVGLELHSGKNRIVRRIFASLGYEVMKLDRVAFASLTKKNLPRGNYRFLTDQEVSFVKMIKAN